MCERKISVLMYNFAGYSDRASVEVEVQCGMAYTSSFGGVSIAFCNVCSGINEGFEEQFLFINGNGWDEYMSEQEWIDGIYSMHYSVDAYHPYLRCYFLHGQLYEFHYIKRGWFYSLDNLTLSEGSKHIYYDQYSCYFFEDVMGDLYGPYCDYVDAKRALDKYTCILWEGVHTDDPDGSIAERDRQYNDMRFNDAMHYDVVGLGSELVAEEDDTPIVDGECSDDSYDPDDDIPF